VAFVADLKALSDQQHSQIVAKDLKREVHLTGAKHEFQSPTCQEYHFELATRWQTAHGTLLDNGTVCISESISDDAEFATLLKKLSDVAIPASLLPVVPFVP
jgi:hypothetical protein